MHAINLNHNNKRKYTEQVSFEKPADEEPPPVLFSKRRKKNQTYTCQNCFQQGHKKTACPNPPREDRPDDNTDVPFLD